MGALFFKLKKKYHHISIFLFDNTLGFIINIIYLLHNNLSKISYFFHKKFFKNFSNKNNNTILIPKKNISRLKETGVSTLYNFDGIENIIKKFNLYFDNKNIEKYTFLDEAGFYFLKREYFKFFEEDLSELIVKQLGPIIEDYYNSYFKIAWTNIYRSYPVPQHEDDRSLLWHFDDNPNDILKLFIYVNDQDKNNGAFRTLLLNDSRKLKFKDKFLSYTTKDRIENQTKINKYKDRIFIAEGRQGDVVAFQNNIVHKGNLPLENHRDLITIEVLRSFLPITKKDVLKKLNEAPKKDYPRFPFIETNF
jgi:hypothetical protein